MEYKQSLSIIRENKLIYYSRIKELQWAMYINYTENDACPGRFKIYLLASLHKLKAFMVYV